MANLTIVVEEDVLKDARIAALEQGTTVNKVLAQRLRELAQEREEARRERRKKAVAELFELIDKSGMRVGDYKWNREELYDRPKK